jgi:hypothetical protein
MPRIRLSHVFHDTFYGKVELEIQRKHGIFDTMAFVTKDTEGLNRNTSNRFSFVFEYSGNKYTESSQETLVEEKNYTCPLPSEPAPKFLKTAPFKEVARNDQIRPAKKPQAKDGPVKLPSPVYRPYPVYKPSPVRQPSFLESSMTSHTSIGSVAVMPEFPVTNPTLVREVPIGPTPAPSPVPIQLFHVTTVKDPNTGNIRQIFKTAYGHLLCFENGKSNPIVLSTMDVEFVCDRFGVSPVFRPTKNPVPVRVSENVTVNPGVTGNQSPVTIGHLPTNTRVGNHQEPNTTQAQDPQNGLVDISQEDEVITIAEESPKSNDVETIPQTVSLPVHVPELPATNVDELESSNAPSTEVGLVDVDTLQELGPIERQILDVLTSEFPVTNPTNAGVGGLTKDTSIDEDAANLMSFFDAVSPK